MTSPYSAGHDHARKRLLARQKLQQVKEEVMRRAELREELLRNGIANSTEGYRRPYRWWPRRKR